MEERTLVSDPPRHARRGDGDGEPDDAWRPRRWPRVLVAIVLVAVVAVVAAWALDTSSGGVARNVVLAGVDVGGVAEEELPVRLADLAATFAEVPVEITAGDHTYRTTAAELGLEVDVRATAAATLAIGDDLFLLARPVAWVTSFFAEREADAVLRVNESVVRPAVIALEGDDRVPPTEPSVELTDDGFALVPGEAGSGIDPATLLAALPARVSSIDRPIQVTVRPAPIPPLGSDEDALAAIAEADRLTGEPLAITTAGGGTTIEPDALRSWVTLDTDENGSVQVGLDPELVSTGLAAALPDLEGGPVDARFTVEGDQVRILPDQDGQVCCAADSAERIIAALDTASREVALDLRVASAAFRTADAEALGIVEEIGSPDAFGPTTHHACCESRVQNIHRIADIVRGVVILPGETFSVNDYVGRRTVENGFVAGGVIINGRFTTDVGGGVSQFATTLFNAALYAGLDFEAYRAHTIYISRYPRGHEATISYPEPNLAITNTTPYGVLLWPEYTDTSITVRVFSTRHAEVAIGTPTSSPSGRCTRWTTPRTRTMPDGTVEQDSVFAVYRPGEGINC